MFTRLGTNITLLTWYMSPFYMPLYFNIPLFPLAEVCVRAGKSSLCMWKPGTDSDLITGSWPAKEKCENITL